MAKHDTKQERFYKVPASVYNSFAFRSLSHKAVALYHHMLTQFNGGNNGNIAATLSMMKHFGWASSATLSSAIKELLEHGLIEKTRQGGMGAMKQCSLYAFTHLPISENTKLGIKGRPATFAFKTYTSIKGKKKPLVQNANGADSVSESNNTATDSHLSGWDSKTLQNPNTVILPQSEYLQ